MCRHDTPHRLSTHAVRRYLFAVTQYCRAVSDLTDEDKKAPTPFHSTEEPLICLDEYIVGLSRRLALCNFTVLLAAVYVGRMAQRTGRCPSIMSVHRLFASSLLYASRVLHGDLVTDTFFAHNAGFAPSEIDRQLQLLDRTLGCDADDYRNDMKAMHYHLAKACRTTLRSDIMQIVADAFGVAPPGQRDLELEDVGASLASFRSVPALASPPFDETTPNGSISQWDSTRSHDSQYLVVRSGATAARSLRGPSPPSSTTPQLALPWPLPCFSSCFPQTIQSSC